MVYTLSNGMMVNLTTNFETAKFLMFKFPQMDVHFVGEVPHMIFNDTVRKFQDIRRVLDENRRKKFELEKMKNEIISEFTGYPFDDECPF